MTHDRLCPEWRCECRDCRQPGQPYGAYCQCELIAEVRADERERNVKMLEAIAEAMMGMLPAEEKEDSEDEVS